MSFPNFAVIYSSIIPLIPLFCGLLLHSLSSALLRYVFLILPPTTPKPPYSAPPHPHPRDQILPLIMSCPGPLMSWKSFVPSVFHNTCTDARAQMERVPPSQPPHIIRRRKSFVERVRQLKKTISEVAKKLIIPPD